MISFWKILYQLVLFSWIDAKGTYFHEPSYIEIRPPGENNSTDFGFSMGYSNKHNKLVIGAPHHDRDGKVFDCAMKDIGASATVTSSEIYINMETLAGDYVREQPDQSFCLGASISVASDFILTCAPLWSTKNETMNIKYGAYGTCFIISESNQTKRYKGLIEQLMEEPKSVKWKYTTEQAMGILNGGSGWSTFVDESNNVAFVSLAPFSPELTGVGYMTASPITPVQFSNILSGVSNFFKKIGTFTSGLFFGDKVSYAFSSRRSEMIGVVAFIQKRDGDQDFSAVKDENAKILNYKDLETDAGTMFGEALCAADINSDGFTDLLVGAPAHVKNAHREYDSGAVHIFLGGKVRMEERRTITLGISGAHFGKAIATSDVDGDGIAEVFVSAPFEDSGDGAVYILNGKELNELVKVKSYNTETPVSDLKLTQRIKNKKYKSFGYCLQALPDLDGNGYNDMAVGAPNSGKVLVYRSVPSIHVNLTVEKPDYLRQKDMSFNLNLTIDVKYPKYLETISEKLLGIVSIVGNGVSFKNGKYSSEFEIDISEKKPTYWEIVEVKIDNEFPATYLFNATIISTFDEYLTSEVFNKSRVQISPFSEANITMLTINRRCTENCEPILTAEIIWTAGEGKYVLGSSTSETVKVIIRNAGNDTFDSCMKIYIKGAEVTEIKAKLESGNWYHYRIPKPLSENGTRLFEVILDMSTLSNLDEKLEVKVHLYNICNKKIDSKAEKEFRFTLNTDQIFIDGVSSERNVTDTQIMDPANKMITDYHVYTVVNNSTVTWRKVNATIYIPKQQFIEAYEISTLKTVNCAERDMIDTLLFTCDFDLKPQPMKFLVTLHIGKEKFVDSLENGHLNITSSFILQLNKEQKMKNITTTLNYKVEVSWGQNMSLIIACSVCLAAIVIALLVFGLYKCGFFKNPDKDKVELLKKEIIKRSIKRPDPNAVQKSQEDNDHQRQLMESIPERKEEVDETSDQIRTSGVQSTDEGIRQSEVHRTSAECSGPSSPSDGTE